MHRAVVRFSNLGGRWQINSDRLSICHSALLSESKNFGGADSSPDPLVATAPQLAQSTYVQSVVICFAELM